jgi:hypothetical protein
VKAPWPNLGKLPKYSRSSIIAHMSIEAIIEAIDLELSRLNSAKVLLSETATSKRKVGRPIKAVTGISAAASKKTRRTLSPEARRKIADAQRLRWKKQKSAAKAA